MVCVIGILGCSACTSADKESFDNVITDDAEIQITTSEKIIDIFENIEPLDFFNSGSYKPKSENPEYNIKDPLVYFDLSANSYWNEYCRSLSENDLMYATNYGDRKSVV